MSLHESLPAIESLLRRLLESLLEALVEGLLERAVLQEE
jgi:hypothetical protein